MVSSQTVINCLLVADNGSIIYTRRVIPVGYNRSATQRDYVTELCMMKTFLNNNFFILKCCLFFKLLSFLLFV